MGRFTSGGVGRDIVAGAVAGVAAIWVADKLDQAIYRKGGAERMRKTEAARPGGMDPAHVLAKRAADAVGVDVGDPKNNPAGHTIHYGVAAAMGAVYGLLRGMSPSITTGRGALYGAAMFILKDEIANTAMRTAGNPLKYPLRDHARGAATHTLFGVVTDLGTRLIAPWRDKVVIEQGPPLSERLDRGREYFDHGREYLYERGRQNIGQGREYLQQGINYAGQLADQARSRLAQVDTADAARRGRRYAGQVSDTVRSRMPDYDDAAGLARAGRDRAGRFAADVRSQLPNVDPAELATAGRRQASRFADDARSYVPEIETSGISRIVRRLFG